MASAAQQRVNEEWNAMAGEWDDLAGPYRDAFFKIIWQQTGLKPGGTRVVVDFGCGTGLLTESMRAVSPSSNFGCFDASPAMVRVLSDKIKAGEWNNVKAYTVALARYQESSEIGEDAMRFIASLKGRVDLVVASSVMSFIPADDLPGTMKAIGEFLKPGGLFCHSDWLRTVDNVDGFTEQKAAEMYAMGGLEKFVTSFTTMKIGESHERQVYVGVATKE